MTNCSYYVSREGLSLESGEQLEQFRLAYTISGNLKAEKTIWVCHALSGHSDVLEWWSGLFNEEGAINPNEYRIICVNLIGSCYGSSSPQDLEEPLKFLPVTIRDNVAAFEQLRNHLRIESIDILIGASLGGQTAVQWAANHPQLFKHLILVATNAVHSPFGKAFNEAQRLALKADLTFGLKTGGQEGLKAARAIAMISYRSLEDFGIKQSDNQPKTDGYRASSYLRYQGEKFCKRFNPHAYFYLTKMMDSHDLGRRRESIQSELNKITAKTLVVGVNSDLLFPYSEQQFLADNIKGACLGMIESSVGHDAFLIEYDQLNQLVRDFLFNDFKTYKPTVLKRTK